MSAQVKHSVGQAVIMIVLAGLAAFVLQLPQIFNQLDPKYLVFLPIVGAVTSALVRVLEGARDSERASTGVVNSADVGYTALKKEALKPTNDLIVSPEGNILTKTRVPKGA